jgi:hypothetical protein
VPKRVIDFDAMWGSDKLAACASWAQAEYAWLYGLADASGSFELTNLRVIWGRVAAIRHDLTLERLGQIFEEFHDKGLIFVWEENGKRYGHWTGSDVPGRLPAPSWRMRLEKLAPPVPKEKLAEYTLKFARGRAASPGGQFGNNVGQSPLPVSGQAGGHYREDLSLELFKPSVRAGVEEPQAQDWNWNKKEKGEGNWEIGRVQQGESRSGEKKSQKVHPSFLDHNSNAENQNPNRNATAPNMFEKQAGAQTTDASGAGSTLPPMAAPVHVYARNKSEAVAREVCVGQGPARDGVHVKSAALERIKTRGASREISEQKSGASGMRPP